MEKIKKSIFGAFTGIMLPFFAYASSGTSTLLFNPLPVAQQLYCPTAYCDLQSMALLILQDMLTIIPILAVLVIIVGGFKLIMSRGNEEKITEAKKTITWAVIGLVAALLSFSIIAIVQNLLSGNV